ncbi:hypothetical protein [Pseudotenacibaculum haliotis]|uniref:Phenylacetate-CoA ligase n=1 Tax=Pseudotenacibaculum haliotis TaxID=1862138 RepID=A0ABW5LMZ1_9FLAO
MEKQLQEHFLRIKSSPMFRSYYDGIEHYQDAPIIQKHQLVDALRERFTLEGEKKGVYLVRSGGSSHKPLIFPVDIQENLLQRQRLAERLTSEGIFSSETIALNLFSYKALYRTASIFDDVLERCNATTLPISSSAPHDMAYKISEEFKPDFILGTPSKLVLYAKYLQIDNKQSNIKNVLYGGEFLLPSQQKILQETLNTQQIYSLYGSAETGIWAWSDFSNSPMHFHFLEDVLIEIINPNEEGFGHIVVTNLLRKRFPLFRYQMGDIGKVIEKDGKKILILAAREDNSFVINADSFFLKDFQGFLGKVDRYQFQLSMNTSFQNEIKVLLIKSDITKEQEKQYVQEITEGLQKHLKCDPQFTILTVEFTDEKELYADPTTSKTPKIKDFRD